MGTVGTVTVEGNGTTSVGRADTAIVTWNGTSNVSTAVTATVDNYSTTGWHGYNKTTQQNKTTNAERSCGSGGTN